MDYQRLSQLIANHPIALLASAVATTAVVLVATGLPLHNLVVEQKSATIETVQQQLKLLEVRLQAKDEQIARYVSKLQEREAKVTSRSLLTNAQLKIETLEAVRSIRTLLSEYNSKSRATLFSIFNGTSDQSEEERHRQRNEDSKESFRLMDQLKSKYTITHKINAILLRDELLSRLPEGIASNARSSSYEYATNTHSIIDVADDLERLAKLLPQGRE